MSSSADALNIVMGASAATAASLAGLAGAAAAAAATPSRELAVSAALPVPSSLAFVAPSAAGGAPADANAVATRSVQGSPTSVTAAAAAAAAAAGVPGAALSPAVVPRPPVTAWRDVTVYVLDVDAHRPRFSTPVQPSIRAAVDVAARCLVDTYGCAGVRQLPLPELVDAFDMWSAALALADAPTFSEMLAEGYGGGLDVAMELALWLVGRARSTLPALLLALIEDLPLRLAPARTRRLAAEAVALRRRLSELLASTNGIIICPVHPTTAPLHDVPLIRPMNVAWTQVFNVTLLPVTAVPMGLDGDGLPVAVQIVGAPCFDRLTIAAAQALEHAGVAGWVPPSAVNDCVHCRFDGAAWPRDVAGAAAPAEAAAAVSGGIGVAAAGGEPTAATAGVGGAGGAAAAQFNDSTLALALRSFVAAHDA